MMLKRATLAVLVLAVFACDGDDPTCPPGEEGPEIVSISPAEVPAPPVAGESFHLAFRIEGNNFQNAIVTVNGPIFLEGEPRVSTDGTVIDQDFEIGCCVPRDEWIGRTFDVLVTTPHGSDSTKVSIVATAGPEILSISPTQIPAPDTPGEFFHLTFHIQGNNFRYAHVSVNGPIYLEGAARVSPDGTVIDQDFEIGCCVPRDEWIGRSFTVFVVSPPTGADFTQVQIVAENP